MTARPCAVGRVGPGGPWLGFDRATGAVPVLVVGSATGVRATRADDDALLALAIAYFEDALDAPPEDLAATHADIGDLVRDLALAEREAGRRAALADAIDAIDDGLAADVVIRRLAAALRSGSAEAAVAALIDAASSLAEDG